MSEEKNNSKKNEEKANKYLVGPGLGIIIMGPVDFIFYSLL